LSRNLRNALWIGPELTAELHEELAHAAGAAVADVAKEAGALFPDARKALGGSEAFVDQ
jgi:hypothetical protein